MQQSVPKASGSRLTKLRKGEEWAAEVIHLTDDKNGVSELPRCPNGSSLIELYLKGNHELTAIPPLFFKRMALLQVLDLSRTSIKSLPKSLPKLVALKKLLLQSCDLFMELSPQVGKLKNLEELDLDETQILDLPRETGKLLKLSKLRVSFYHLCGKKKFKSNILIHPETISNLSQLAELSIDVNPADKRWDDSVEAVLREVCNSKTLRSLILYLPEVQLLDNISLLYPSLSCFRFTVGRNNRRIISRVPHEVEAEFRNWETCFKFVSGENIPIEIKQVLKYSTSFFLDRHATAVNLSEFGIESMKGLKLCLLSECNKMETLIDGEMHYDRTEDDQSESAPDSVKHVLESLEYLSIYYMENLQSIWRGPDCFAFMSKLKFLALHTCPRLSQIFSHTLIENFVNLEEIILEDCPQVTSLVSHASVKPIMSDKMFLPRLKRLLFLYLPELVSISNGLLIAPKLESIGCYNCPKLKSISKMELSSETLKIIQGERQWWEDMNWNETEWGNQPDYLMRIFSPIDNDKDVMTQLVEDRDLLEAAMQNEGQELGDKNLLEGSTQDDKGQCLEERIMGTNVIESPSACILSSCPLLRTSLAPEQAGSFISEKYKSLEDDRCVPDSIFFEEDVDSDEPKPKRWNCTENENKGIIGSSNQYRSKVFVFDDGYRWINYGKKMVKGDPYPRSYFKCLSTCCPVKKRVEQDSEDPSFFVTKYKGVHNHGNVRGLYNLRSEPFNDHMANNMEDVIETAKTFSTKKGGGYGDVIQASIQNKEAPQLAGLLMPASAPQFYQQSPSVPIPEHYRRALTTTSVGAASPPLLPGSYIQGPYGPVLSSGLTVGETSLDGPKELSSSMPSLAGSYPSLPSFTGPSSNSQKEQIFPERPGEVECQYFLRTGNCTFGSSCKFHHPRDWVVPQTNCVLNPMGLPLHPGVHPCAFYLQKGQCKFGSTCKYDHPVLMDDSNVLPSPEIGNCVVQSLNQKNNSGNDQQTTSHEDNNSADVCHTPPPSPSATSSTISQLSATAHPTIRIQTQSFEELDEQNQSNGNLQSQVCCYKQDADLVKSRKAADEYTWKSYGTKELSGNQRKSSYSYRCAYPGCRGRSVEKWLDGQIAEVIHIRHCHPESHLLRTSSQSAFSHIIRGSDHLTIKIPDKSSVTYEGGQMDANGLVFFMRLVEDEMGLQNLMDKSFDQPSDRRKADVGVDVRKAKKSLRKPEWMTHLKVSIGNSNSPWEPAKIEPTKVQEARITRRTRVMRRTGVMRREPSIIYSRPNAVADHTKQEKECTKLAGEIIQANHPIE